MILAPVHHAAGFLHGDVVEREQGTVFAHCPELVGCHDRLYDIRDLPLHVALRYVHPAERVVGTELAAVSRVQPVLLFQLGGDALAAPVDEVTVEPPAVFVHIDGNDVQVVAVDVLVLEYKIRLVAVTQPVEILACELFQLRIGQMVVGVRIERNVDDLITRAHLLRHEALEIPLGTCHVHPSVAVVKNPVHGKEPAFTLIHFQTVVGECAVQRCPHAYLRDHLSSNSLESSTTCCVRAASSLVHCSSL